MSMGCQVGAHEATFKDRKSTRLNSSHLGISYAVFCLKKKIERNAGGLHATITNLSPMIRSPEGTQLQRDSEWGVPQLNDSDSDATNQALQHARAARTT